MDGLTLEPAWDVLRHRLRSVDRRRVQFFGVDLAWSEGASGKAANESGLVLIDETGRVLDAGWACGVDQVANWLTERATPGAVIAIDAPLVVHNPPKTMRECEREVAVRYGRWGFSAYPTHPDVAWLGGVVLRQRLESAGYFYTDGTTVADPDRITMFECYPNTTIVGMPELGYDERKPKYKGRTKSVPAAESRIARAAACDELIARLGAVQSADPPLDLAAHEVTRSLLDDASPLADTPFKHREDLLDAVICAWTASIWHRHGEERVLVLGRDSPADSEGRRATIVAPARAEHRVPTLRSRLRAPSDSFSMPTLHEESAFQSVLRQLQSVDRLTEEELSDLRAELRRLEA